MIDAPVEESACGCKWQRDTVWGDVVVELCPDHRPPTPENLEFERRMRMVMDHELDQAVRELAPRFTNRRK